MTIGIAPLYRPTSRDSGRTSFAAWCDCHGWGVVVSLDLGALSDFYSRPHRLAREVVHKHDRDTRNPRGTTAG